MHLPEKGLRPPPYPFPVSYYEGSIYAQLAGWRQIIQPPLDVGGRIPNNWFKPQIAIAPKCMVQGCQSIANDSTEGPMGEWVGGLLISCILHSAKFRSAH